MKWFMIVIMVLLAFQVFFSLVDFSLDRENPSSGGLAFALLFLIVLLVVIFRLGVIL